MPFWVLQAFELLSLVALADLSFHVQHGALLVGVGCLFACLALSADGPLGIVRLCGRKLHVSLLVLVSIIVAACPVAPVLRPDIEGIIIVELIAVGMLRLATLTVTRPGPARSIRQSGAPFDAAALEDSAPPNRTEDTAGPVVEQPSASSSAARWAGRAAAAASAAALEASARHRPAAEAGAKQAIRHMGKIASRARARSAPGRRSPDQAEHR